MVLDTLAERGYHAVYQERRTPVPQSFDLQTGRDHLPRTASSTRSRSAFTRPRSGAGTSRVAPRTDSG